MRVQKVAFWVGMMARLSVEMMVRLLLIIVLFGSSLAWSGFVLSVFWGWFVAPTFGVREISMPVAFGLILIARTIKDKGSEECIDADDANFERKFLARNLAAEWARAVDYAYILSAAWLIKVWM